MTSPTNNGNHAESLEEKMEATSRNQSHKPNKKTAIESKCPKRKYRVQPSSAERIEKAKLSRKWAIEQSKDALSKLEESLQEGKSETLVRYLQVLGRFHNYSFRNLLLIVAQRPDAAHVAGFSTWKKLGRNVLKGEKGIRILAPVKYGKSNQKNASETENEMVEDQNVLVGFKTVHVFDISQTEGQPFPEFSQITGDPGEYLDRLHRIVEETGIAVVMKSIPGGALGVSKGGKIEIARGQSPEEEFTTLAHEFAHELMHRKIDRTKNTKTLRETEAEAVAYAICYSIGLDTTSQSTDYIHLYQGDAELLQESLAKIQKTAAWIINAIMHVEG